MNYRRLAVCIGVLQAAINDANKGFLSAADPNCSTQRALDGNANARDLVEALWIDLGRANLSGVVVALARKDGLDIKSLVTLLHTQHAYVFEQFMGHFLRQPLGQMAQNLLTELIGNFDSHYASYKTIASQYIDLCTTAPANDLEIGTYLIARFNSKDIPVGQPLIYYVSGASEEEGVKTFSVLPLSKQERAASPIIWNTTTGLWIIEHPAQDCELAYLVGLQPIRLKNNLDDLDLEQKICVGSPYEQLSRWQAMGRATVHRLGAGKISHYTVADQAVDGRVLVSSSETGDFVRKNQDMNAIIEPKPEDYDDMVNKLLDFLTQFSPLVAHAGVDFILSYGGEAAPQITVLLSTKLNTAEKFKLTFGNWIKQKGYATLAIRLEAPVAVTTPENPPLVGANS